MTDNTFYGFVEDNNDPLRLGRVKVRVIGLYDSLKTSELPWLQIEESPNSLFASVGPPKGTQVKVKSLDKWHQNLIVTAKISGISQNSHDNPDFIRNDGIPSIVSIKNSNKINNFEPSASDNYGAVYPYNRGFESLSGHVLEIDDSSGKERIDIFHKSGSYLEFTNSSTIFKSTSDLYQINSGNFIGYSGSNYNLTVSDVFTATCPVFNYNGNVFVNGSLFFSHCYGYGGSGIIHLNDNVEVESSKYLNINTINATSGATVTVGNSLYVNGNITATGSISGSISDDRLKIKLNKIDNALEKVLALEGFIYKPNEKALKLGVEDVQSVGVSAQTLQKILPEAVKNSAFEGYLTIQYEKIVPLLIEAFKELHKDLQDLKSKL